MRAAHGPPRRSSTEAPRPRSRPQAAAAPWLLQTGDKARGCAAPSGMRPRGVAQRRLRPSRSAPTVPSDRRARCADAFNEVVEQNASMAAELSRLRQVVGREGRLKQRATLPETARLLGPADRLHQRAHRRSRPSHQRSRARDRRGRRGRPHQVHGAGGRQPPAAGRVPPHRQDHQPDGGAARRLLRRSDPRRARGRHRRQARRPGRGQGRRRHLEGPDRLRQLDGRQPHRPGAQHRRRHHRRRAGRPVQEDRGRRQGRVPDAEEHHQHDGGPAALVRVGSDPRGARGRHRRLAGRPGRRGRRRRDLEGPDRLRQLDGRQPDLRRCATSPT